MHEPHSSGVRRITHFVRVEVVMRLSLEKTARRSKFAEEREVKQDVQLSDDKQNKVFPPRGKRHDVQTRRAATNDSNRRFSSARKTARHSKLVERQQTIQIEDFPPRKTARRSKLVERQRTIQDFLPRRKQNWNF